MLLQIWLNYMKYKQQYYIGINEFLNNTIPLTIVIHLKSDYIGILRPKDYCYTFVYIM